MNKRKIKKIIFQIALFAIVLTFNVSGQEDLVAGDLVQFNDNGAWCWYQDERAVVDTVLGKIIMGSDGSGSGTGGSARNGKVEGIIYNMATGSLDRSTFRSAGCDDHNAPGFIIRPDGQYLAMYADHYDQWNSRYQIYNGSAWGGEQRFDWTTIPGGTDYTIAYSNLYYLSAEERMYNFARANHRSPNFIYSDNMGDTWSFGGQLSTNNTDSYNKGYYKYWGNGIDKIDFICTEEHPRDGLTSMYHGFIQNGKTYTTDGTLIDANVFDAENLPSFENFTKIFSDSTIVGEDTLRKVWNADLVRYDNGEIAAILTARINNIISGYNTDPTINPDHAFVYCRYNGTAWSWTYLGQAGKKMYSSEADYTGLGALDPNDPDIIYISTHVDPRDDSELVVREIFKGITDDDGATWSWTPVTWNSTRNNYRPVVPYWDKNNTALLWMRGSYNAAQSYDIAIVGLIEKDYEDYGLKTYVDASIANTTESDDSPFERTGPSGSEGADDNLWHEHTGYGNSGSVFTSSENGNGEDASTLKTTVKAPETGTFDVWVNFWADPASDWRIKAGLSESGMQIYRHMASEQVENGEHTAALTLTGAGNTFLYQAYVGRVETAADSTFAVYVDDHAIQTGSTGTLVGNSARTWYDGISYTAPLYVTIDTEELTLLDSANSIASFEILSNTNWDISSSEAWLTPNILAGTNNDTIILTAEENNTGIARLAIVNVSADYIEDQIVTVYQQPASPALLVSTNTLSIGVSENSTAVFDITSNTAWTIESSQYWLTADQQSGINNSTIILKATFNASSTQRVATITVSADGVASQIITVTQGENSIFEVSETSLTVDEDEGSTVTFDIYSNTIWTIESSETWLEPDVTFGSDSATIILTADANTLSTTRNATITVSSDGIASQVITVTQDAYIILEVSATSLLVDADEGSIVTFNITSSENWAIESNETWLVSNVTSGSDNATITLTAEENITNANRNATVTVTVEGLATRTISVTQAVNPIESLIACNKEFGYVFPNPAIEILNVKLTTVPARVSLYTLEGKQLMDIISEEASFEIDLSSFSKGIYLLQIINDEQTFTKKIIRN